MKIQSLKTIGSWRDVADAANTTISKEAGTTEPSSSWKLRMLMCEHSPIRNLFIKVKFIDLPSWVSVHFVRHKIGVEHFVSTQRTDRTGTDRTKAPQDAPVTHEMILTTQAVINMSRKRLCKQASPETREAWMMFLGHLKQYEPELVDVCIPDCVYRQFCCEYKPCGFDKTTEYNNELEYYISNILDARKGLYQKVQTFNPAKAFCRIIENK